MRLRAGDGWRGRLVALALGVVGLSLIVLIGLGIWILLAGMFVTAIALLLARALLPGRWFSSLLPATRLRQGETPAVNLEPHEVAQRLLASEEGSEAKSASGKR